MESKITGGYILLSRQLIESEIWDKPPIYMKVWMYLLMRAQYKPYKKLKRGELIVTIPEIIEVCSYKVGYRTEKPSKSQIFNVLEWLRNSDEGSHEDNANETMIGTTKTTRGIVVNICNYNVYQDPKSYEQNDEYNDEKSMKTTMPKRQANTINKNVKNLRSKELSSSSSSDGDLIDSNLKEVMQFYQSNLQSGINESPHNQNKILELYDSWGKDLLIASMKLATEKEKKGVSFVTGILNNWESAGVKTVEDARAQEISFKRNFKSNSKNNNVVQMGKRESKYDNYNYGF